MRRTADGMVRPGDGDEDPLPSEWIRTAAGLAVFEHLAEIASTMDRGRELALDAGVPLPALVVADRQTRGRGRRDARWWQPAGALAMSVVVDAAAVGGDSGGVPSPAWSLACGIAVAEAVSTACPGLEARIRWPNDVVCGGRKLAGILVETQAAGRVIFGIGINSCGRSADAPAAIRGRVGTLPDLCGLTVSRGSLIVACVPRLLDLLRELAAAPETLVTRFRPLCALAGRDVTVFTLAAGGGERRITGRCLGIDRAGALVVETGAGAIHLASGSLTPPDDVWRGDDPPLRSA